MPSTVNSLDTDQTMSNGSEANNQAPLVQLLAQLVQGQQTFEQAMTQLLAQPPRPSKPLKLALLRRRLQNLMTTTVNMKLLTFS